MAIKQQIPPERMSDGKYILDDAEKAKILEGWNSNILNLKKLTEYTWPGLGLDGKSFQGKAMKVFLAERNYAPKSSAEYQKKSEDPLFQLKEHEKEFIKNHASELKPMEIAKKLWGELPLGDLRVKLCLEFYKELPPELLNAKFVMTTKDYTPPKTQTQLVARLRDYRIVEMDESKFNNRDKECIRQAIKYCHTFRFISEMNSITKIEERQFCEAQFLKFVHNKSDLSEEDCEMYISLCLSTLDTRRMRQELVTLIEIRDDQLSTTDANGKPQINMALGEQITEIRKEVGAREARQEATIKKLTGEREQRLKAGGGTNFNIANLVEIFKEKDKRDKIIKLAEQRKKKLGEEVEKLSSMDALKFEAFGLNKGEAMT